VTYYISPVRLPPQLCTIQHFIAHHHAISATNTISSSACRNVCRKGLSVALPSRRENSKFRRMLTRHIELTTPRRWGRSGRRRWRGRRAQRAGRAAVSEIWRWGAVTIPGGAALNRGPVHVGCLQTSGVRVLGLSDVQLLPWLYLPFR
jgi:hypothetical protein